ncbi:MAG: hypothetical protein IID18_10065 [Nitrospinae bacterium]|nr:hypothetical protein [Nitrospinota bacterium]
MDSSSLTFLSGGEVVGVEYSKSVRGKKQKARSAVDPRFAVLLTNGNKVDRETFQNYLSENGIDHRTDRLGSYLILWNFKGETGAVDGLRSLIG